MAFYLTYSFFFFFFANRETLSGNYISVSDSSYSFHTETPLCERSSAKLAVIGVHDLYPKEASANALVDSFIKT